MANLTKKNDFTIIKENNSKVSFNISKSNKTDFFFDILEAEFTNALNKCTGKVIMKKRETIIHM